ncbi:ParB/RepB/Spo0J family partition protein [Agrobacterium tumefaciens]|uniref:ParB/RepB/Spo0J family partition protein n=1 Tax=Agrobacterium tumefaciens TaxID=358 RepID=UPI0015745FE4|nr:ParB/RepB/Spo0J family partition protein [Agrobacterium tumefaciens]NTB01093.1 ParB N-terminal domain-containing protein [Agrobacterium tumefaciens]
MSEKLKLSQIRTDGGTQSRASLNENVASEYADLMRSGTVFPPLVVFHDGADYWLADGFHRHEALGLAGLEEVDADLRQGTRRDAILYSVGANASHGLRRTNEDKRRAVSTLLQDAEWSTWSDREIARRTGVSNQFVGTVRSSVNAGQIPTVRTVERNGTTYQQNTAAIGKVEPHVVPEAISLIRGTDLDTVEYWDKLKKLPPNEQIQAVKRDRALLHTAPDGDEGGYDPFAIHSNRERIRDELPDSIKQIEATKEAARSSRKVDADDLAARIEELEESQRVLEADYAAVLAENKSFEDMRVQFEKGGFAEVIAGKDEEISVLKTRLYSESQTAAEWRRKCNFWKDQAKKLGWRDERFEGKTEALPDDDAFYDVVNGG